MTILDPFMRTDKKKIGCVGSCGYVPASVKNKEMVFGNGVKNIQAASYNGACTVCKYI
jgi:hypothetical protein